MSLSGINLNKHDKRKDLSRSLCILFFRNVDWLRLQRGLSLRELSEGISDEGFKVSQRAISRYIGKSKHEYFNVSTYYMAAFSLYFGEPMEKLLSCDYEQEDKIRGQIKNK